MIKRIEKNEIEKYNEKSESFRDKINNTHFLDFYSYIFCTF